MADKEAKLAAARQRAEALKAKKAQKAKVQKEDAPDTKPEEDTANKEESDSSPKISDNTDLAPVDGPQDNEIPADIGTDGKIPIETDATVSSPVSKKDEPESKPASTSQSAEAEIAEKNPGKGQNHEELDNLKEELEQLRAAFKQLEQEKLNVDARASHSLGEQRQQLQDSQERLQALQTENTKLLGALEQSRNACKALEDERLALTETTERLMKELKIKSIAGRSRDSSRHRISKDFDRSAILEDVTIQDAPRRQSEIAAQLKKNISIDLMFWYDKHAGEVIEV